jgi:hypothetical protein
LDGEPGWLAALDSDLDLIDAGEAEWRAADAERVPTAGSGSDAPGLMSDSSARPASITLGPCDPRAGGTSWQLADGI